MSKKDKEFENKPESSKEQLKNKSGGSAVQNPDHNNEVHKESLGPNAKR